MLKSTAPAAAASKPVLEPKAIEILKAACARLAAAHSMSFTAVVTDESPSRVGFPLAYSTKSEVVMQRPNKLRVITLGDGPASEFYYDGKIMMAYAPRRIWLLSPTLRRHSTRPWKWPITLPLFIFRSTT